MPKYSEYLEELRRKVSERNDIELTAVGVLKYTKEGKEYPYDYVRIMSKEIGPNDSVLLIRSTIHGDESAGSFTILNHLDDIIDEAHAHGVKVIIYPVDNPSGFEEGTRYNLEDDSGDGGNNDFIRYELADGSIADDIGTSKEWKSWMWASDPSLEIYLPQETQLLHTDLKTLPLSQVRAVLDIHQDNFIISPGAYWYGFGDTLRYQSIVDEVKTFTRVFANEHIDSGFLNGPSYVAEQAGPDGQTVPDQFDPVTDARGFIERHDGSLTDLFFHLGAEHCITIETTSCAPADVCDRVNMAWVRGVIELVGG